MGNLIPLNLLIFLRLMQNTEISLNILIQFEMLLHLFKRIQIFIFRFCIMLIFSFLLLLHISFINDTNQLERSFTNYTNPSKNTGHPSDYFTVFTSLIVVANS